MYTFSQIVVSFRGRHHYLETLKQALVEAVDNFPMDVVRTAIDARPNRLWGSIRANGGHFE